MSYLAISSHAKYLHERQSDQEDSDPHTDVDIGGRLPKFDRQTCCSDLERQDRQPAYSIIPANRKAPTRINEADCVGEEGAVDWEQYSKLG